MNTEFGYLPVGFHVTLYYLIISFIGILFFIHTKKDKFSIFLFLIFFGGVFSYWGELLDNLFKISLIFFSVLLFLDTKQKLYIDIKIVGIFFLFSITFWLSIYFNRNPIIYSLSQYSKFLIPILLLFFIINKITTLESNLYYLNFVLKLIILQVLFSIIKFFTIGFSESYVGSVITLGGNSATFLPILGLLIIYSINNGNIKIRDTILLSSMLFISIMSFKRIIWFIYPIVLIAMSVIWGRTKYLKYLIFLAPLIFYLGVRLNPTLNKESKIWGSFDLIYAIEYAQEYSGLQSNASSNYNPSSGRFYANGQMLKYIGNNIKEYKTWFGYGPKSIYGTSYTEYEKGKWGVADKGSLSGAGRFLIAYGLLGLFLYLLLIILFFYENSYKKYKLFIIIFFLLEFFFYLDSLILPFLLIPLFLISNYVSLFNKNNLLDKIDMF